MEITTDVRKNAITHQDFLGNWGRNEAGDVLPAGTARPHVLGNRRAYLVSACGKVKVSDITLDAPATVRPSTTNPP